MGDAPQRDSSKAAETPAVPVAHARSFSPDERAALIGSPLTTLIEAAVFLFVGFAYGFVSTSDDMLFTLSVTVFVWGTRIIGFLFVVAAVLQFAKMSVALTWELVVSAAAGLLCGVVGAIWIAHGVTTGYLVVILAVVGASAALSAARRWRILHNIDTGSRTSPSLD